MTNEHKRNEMMDRPVVMPELVEYMRENMLPFTGNIKKVQEYAQQRGMPIVPQETARFLDLMTKLLKPEQILEIGTCIGFSAMVMATNLAPGGKLTTIDRYQLMYDRAEANFARYGYSDQIELLKGDAADILPTLESDYYDFIFMDSAKAKYLEFTKECLRLLRSGGLLVIDDVFQGGTILEDESQRPRRVRKIHRKLNELLDTALSDPVNKSALVPLGDGLLLILKD